MENRELEKAVLSIISADANMLLDTEINEDYFTTTTHKKLFKLFKIHHSNFAIIQGKLEESELNEFFEICGTIVSINDWKDDVEQLRELMLTRKYHTIAKQIQISCEAKEPFKKIKNRIEDFEVEEIREENKQEVLQNIGDIMLGQRDFVFHKTGYTKLDELIVGFVPGQLNVIAARPSVGKTMFGLNIMLNQRQQGKKVAYFSLEMSQLDIYSRIVANIGGFSMYETRKVASQDTLMKFSDACEKLLKEDSIDVIDRAVQISDIIKEIRYLNAKKGTEIFFIDYVGLIEGEGENRNMEITRVTRALKMLAIKLNVVIVIASQLSRAIEKRGLQEPLLSDLRDSGSIEQDADCVIMLQRDLDEEPRNMKIYVRKNRNGSVGELSLDCEGRIMKIHDREYQGVTEDLDKPF